MAPAAQGSTSMLPEVVRSSSCLSIQVRVYNETGFLWEHYDDTDGHGKGTHPFTGWTALLVLVAGASY